MTMFLNSKGDMVWCKIKGRPWWPGLIIDVKRGNVDEQVTVSLISENLQVVLTNNKVADFKKYFQKYFNAKESKLIEATNIAQNILTGLTTFDKESKNWMNKVIPKDKQDNLSKFKGKTNQTLTSKKKSTMKSKNTDEESSFNPASNLFGLRGQNLATDSSMVNNDFHKNKRLKRTPPEKDLDKFGNETLTLKSIGNSELSGNLHDQNIKQEISRKLLLSSDYKDIINNTPQNNITNINSLGCRENAVEIENRLRNLILQLGKAKMERTNLSKDLI